MLEFRHGSGLCSLVFEECCLFSVLVLYSVWEMTLFNVVSPCAEWLSGSRVTYLPGYQYQGF